MDRAGLEDACRSLPIFPLPGTVLMPGSLLPLHVFEPRYRELIVDCVRDGRPLSVCQIDPREVDAAPYSPAVLPYAGIGLVSAHHELEDGRYNVLIQPIGRIRILEELPSDRAYRTVRAELLPELPVLAGELAGEGERVRSLFTPLVGRMGKVGDGVSRALQSLPAARVPEALASVVIRTDEGRQRFLSENDPLVRAGLVEEAVLTLLAELVGTAAAEA